MSSDHRAEVTALSLLPVPNPLLFILTRSSHIQGAVTTEGLMLKSKARLQALTSLFAVQRRATFFTSLSLRFSNCKARTTVLISQGYGENGMIKHAQYIALCLAC